MNSVNMRFVFLFPVRVSRVIIECVEDFHESQGKPRQSPETSV